MWLEAMLKLMVLLQLLSLNRQVKLFRFYGKDTMWFWPGDKNFTVEVAKTLAKNLLVPTIINYAYECGADSEWIKSHCGLLYVA